MRSIPARLERYHIMTRKSSSHPLLSFRTESSNHFFNFKQPPTTSSTTILFTRGLSLLPLFTSALAAPVASPGNGKPYYLHISRCCKFFAS